MRISSPFPTSLRQTLLILSASGYLLLQPESAAQTYVNRHYNPDTSYSLQPVTITGAVEWTEAGSPYVLEGWDWNLVVAEGATLTIEPGVVVSAPVSRDGGALEIRGTLKILGTEAKPIRLVRNEAAGTWSGIRFLPGSSGQVQHAVLEDSGHVAVGWQAWHPGAALYFDDAAPLVQNVTILRSGGQGMLIVKAASPTIEDCQVEQAAAYAIHWSSYATNSAPVLRRNGGTGNHWDAVYVANGTLSGTVTLHRNEIPYYLQGWDGHLTVEQPGSLTVEAGTLIKCAYGRDGGAVVVRGRMDCQGTAGAPVVLTSEYDDSLGGDTNLDGTNSVPAPGAWSGVRFEAGGSGTWTETVVRYAGHVSQGWQGWHPQAAFYLVDSSPTLDRVTIEYSQDIGVRFSASAAKVVDCTIRHSGGSAAAVVPGGLTALPDFAGTLAQSNRYNGIALTGPAGSLLLANHPLPYVIYDWLTVPTNSVVTVEPGTLIMFAYQDNSSYKCGLQVEGRFEAIGTPERPIRFTSVYDTAPRGGIVAASMQRDPAPGDWNTLYYQPDSQGELAFCEIVYAGYLNENWNYLGGGAVTVRQASPRLANNRILNTGGAYAGDGNHGIRLENSASLVQSNVIEKAAGYAVCIYGEATIALPALVGNTAVGCGIGGVRLPVAFKTDAQLEEAGMPYVINNSTLIGTNTTLTVAGGNVMKFRDTGSHESRQWTVLGRLIVNGTPAHPVVFTTIRDDSVGGDTAGDGEATQPRTDGWGDWAALVVQPGAEVNLAGTTLRYGGYDNLNWNGAAGALISMWGGTVTLSDCALRDPGLGWSQPARCLYQRAGSLTALRTSFQGGNYGVLVSGAEVCRLDDCQFGGQTTFGVQNAGNGLVDGRDSFWGDPSGPLDDADDRATGGSYNPAGKGVRVSNQVLYDPWRTSLGEEFTVDILTAVELVWPSRIGSTYMIQISDLQDGSWSNFGDPITGTGQSISRLISTRGVTKKFYRVQLLGP